MSYYARIVRQVELGGDALMVASKPGTVSWQEVAAASELIARHTRIDPGRRVVVFECGTGALAAWAGKRAEHVSAFDQSVLAGRTTAATLGANDITNVTVHSEAWPTCEVDGTFDVALLPLPKGRAYSRILLAAAWRVLGAGGCPFLAGAGKAGVKALVKDTFQLFGNAETLAYKSGNRVAMAVKGERPSDQPDWPGRAIEFEASELKLFGIPGVFSSGAHLIGASSKR